MRLGMELPFGWGTWQKKPAEAHNYLVYAVLNEKLLTPVLVNYIKRIDATSAHQVWGIAFFSTCNLFR